MGGASAPFSPKALSGLVAWYRADLGVTIATGVSAWADQSGSGDANKNLAQATGTKQPTFVASDAGFNNKPTLSFVTASSRSMQSGTFAAAPSQPYTLYLVGNVAGVGTETLMDGLTTNRALLQSSGAASLFFAGAFLSGAGAVSTKQAICVVVNGVSSAIYLSSVSAPSVSGDAGAQALTGLTVGADIDGISNAMTGKIAELAMFSGAHSLSQRQAMMNYLGSRYAVTIT